MFNDFLKTAESLYKEKETFAMAMVVNRQIPSSGKPGDKAIIRKNGEISGWIGGGCTRGIVLKEANDAINDGKPRLVRIKPNGESISTPGVKEYPMTCHSGGAVEIYIEPIIPRPQLVILGKSHVAMALSKIARAMDYSVQVMASRADKLSFPGAEISNEVNLTKDMIYPNTCVVVCTQGENDEDALEQAILSGASYISFVSSRRKASAMFTTLRKRGIDFDQLAKVKTPAGIKINAKLPEEVAISILAEIIEFIRSEDQAFEENKASSANQNYTENPEIFINPVCGVPVEKSTAKHVIEYKDQSYYFCCDGCKVSFEKEPEKYALA